MGGQSNRPIPEDGTSFIHEDDMTFYPYEDLTIGYPSVSATENNVRSQGQYVGLQSDKINILEAMETGSFLKMLDT